MYIRSTYLDLYKKKLSYSKLKLNLPKYNQKVVLFYYAFNFNKLSLKIQNFKS